MKKIILFLCLLMALSACRSIDTDSIKADLDDTFTPYYDAGTYRINNFMPYYSYYLPGDMSEETLDSDSIVLKYGDSRIIMNLNIANIINTRYYPKQVLNDEGFFNEEYLIYISEGDYETYTGEKKDYIYRLYDYEGTYVLHLCTSDMNYYGTVAAEDIGIVTRHLLTIARNSEVNSDEVVSAFSNKDVIVYKKKQINLFDTSIQNNGDIANLLIDDAIIGDGIYRDGQIEEDDSQPADETIPGEEIPSEEEGDN